MWQTAMAQGRKKGLSQGLHLVATASLVYHTMPRCSPVDCSNGRLHGQSAGQHEVGQDPDGQEVADFAQEAPPVLNCFTQS